METLSADPGRFKRYREPPSATILRTGGIALVVASVAFVIGFHRLPSTSIQWQNWLALVVFLFWISFGGHWVEIIYLNRIRPRLAHWSDFALMLVRLCVWEIGGAVLFVGAVVSR